MADGSKILAGEIGKSRTIDDLDKLPEGRKWELIGGIPVQKAMPTVEHQLVADDICADTKAIYHRKRREWWIMSQPHCMLPPKTKSYLIPDVAGWRRSNMPQRPEGKKVQVIPDWVCECLSDSTEGYDKHEKAEIYARAGVGHYWIVDPRPGQLKLDAFENVAGEWKLLKSFAGDAMISAAPFEEAEICLDDILA